MEDLTYGRDPVEDLANGRDPVEVLANGRDPVEDLSYGRDPREAHLSKGSRGRPSLVGRIPFMIGLRKRILRSTL